HELLAADFFHNQISRLVPKEQGKGFLIEEAVPKIGRASAITKAVKGLYVSGYASGNITWVKGRDGFLTLTDLDKIIDLEIIGQELYLARFGHHPTLLKFDLQTEEKTILENDFNISALVAEDKDLWVVFAQNKKSALGKIVENKLVEVASLDCLFPVKVAFAGERLFYTSIADPEGRVFYSLKKNLQKNGR
ncbi:hypothetical protein ACFLZP_04645, partial [Patescibacteria group bacterium]